MTDDDRILILVRLMTLNDYETDRLNQAKISIENYKKLVGEEKKEMIEAKEMIVEYLEDSIKENNRLIKMLEEVK